jgi:hypothetical protein
MDSEPGAFKLRHPGGARTKGQKQADNVSLKYGNSRAYIEARLARDAGEGCREAAALLQGIRDRRITHYAAAIEMHYSRRREPTGRVEYPNVTKKNDWAMHRVLNPRPQGKAPPGGTSGA